MARIYRVQPGDSSDWPNRGAKKRLFLTGTGLAFNPPVAIFPSALSFSRFLSYFEFSNFGDLTAFRIAEIIYIEGNMTIDYRHIHSHMLGS